MPADKEGMKFLIIPLMMMSTAGYAQEKCATAANPLKDIQALCADLNSKNQAHCDVKTQTQKENVPAITYGILSASSKMKGLFSKLDSLQQAFVKDAGGCPGGCSKVNAPIVEIHSKPTASVPNPACPANYSVMSVEAGELSKFGVSQSEKFFKRSFKGRGPLKTCQEQASTFAQETLMGDNDFGKFLEDKKCVSPCSYSSTIRMKTLPTDDGQCSVELELAVLCGPPKKDREWVTEASLTKAFKCEVQK